MARHLWLASESVMQWRISGAGYKPGNRKYEEIIGENEISANNEMAEIMKYNRKSIMSISERK
jgi:FlaA1/EpsC-like NDP-sugar epimerase